MKRFAEGAVGADDFGVGMAADVYEVDLAVLAGAAPEDGMAVLLGFDSL